jgi:hypothetical protein
MLLECPLVTQAVPVVFTAATSAPWVGPAFSLIKEAFKLWATSKKIVPAAISNLKTCKYMLHDILGSWDHLAMLGDKSERMKDAVGLLEKAVSECLTVYQNNRCER